MLWLIHAILWGTNYK